MKKFFSLLFIIALFAIGGCGAKESDGGDKIQITASLFPQYDFARIIGGDKVEVSLLLSPGQESHMYDPSPRDMAKISESDLFIFTGEEMESWAADIASSVGSNVKILDVSERAILCGTDDDSQAVDPHIWLDFDNAMIMCENIYSALIGISPENEAYFKSNLESLEDELSKLDDEYEEAFSSSDKTLVFGGRFALGYLVKKYNINYLSAYTSCGSESEPSVRIIKSLSDYVKENDVKVVYCEEMSDPKVARSITDGTDAEILVIHSAENVSLEESESNVSFIDIMRQNLENIRRGLE